jgi:pimeloyl-ACP methyl ester carboxylesterase
MCCTGAVYPPNRHFDGGSDMTMRHRLRAIAGVAVLSLVAGVLVGGPAAGAATSTTAADGGRRTITGTLDGADYRIEMPARWNGTLLLYSHGYLPPGFPTFGISLTNRPPGTETEGWLLDHGYALAGSQMSEGGLGYHVERGLREQIALLDWFEANIGRPRHTVATGQSLGATIAILLAERHPDRFAGVMTVCGAPNPLGDFNMILDLNFAVRTLLAPDQDIDIVHPRDPTGSMNALAAAVDQAVTTPQGRARLALVASFGNITGWFSAHQPRPTEMDEVIRAQAQWIKGAYIYGQGPVARADLEPRAGGNPSWNTGVDYRHQLAASSQTEQVLAAYRAAGLDVKADLARLNAAPRIAADPAAVRFIRQFGVPTGDIEVPVVTLHTIGDGGAVPDLDRWYGERVRHEGGASRLRQFYVDRGMHCAINAGEEITTLRTLFTRIDSGRWPNTSPRRLNEAANDLGEGYRLVLDLGTFKDAPMPPAFKNLTPPRFMRP